MESRSVLSFQVNRRPLQSGRVLPFAHKSSGLKRSLPSPARSSILVCSPSQEGRPTSLRSSLQRWLQKQSTHADRSIEFKTPEEVKIFLKKQNVEGVSGLGCVAVVGAGIAGLIAAINLQKMKNTKVTLFESSARPGGRMFTHYFTGGPNDPGSIYYEAGAMRIPSTHKRVSKLISDLNSSNKTQCNIDLIDYVMSNEKARVYVNGKKKKDSSGKETFWTKKEADHCPDALGFGSFNGPADHLLQSVFADHLGKLHEAVKRDEELNNKEDEELNKVFWEIVDKWDSRSLHDYLVTEKKWTQKQINYVETMTDQTNAFHVSYVEELMDAFEFGDEFTKWHTIDGGMQRLPEACLEYVKAIGVNVSMSTKVTAVEAVQNCNEGPFKVRLTYEPEGGSSVTQEFDKVLLAIPPSSLRLMKTPQWSVEKTHAIRALRFDPIRKIGLHFNTRWWEESPISIQGGQSITDLPSRWIVYPSNGRGEGGQGALLCYSWSSDAHIHLSMTEKERVTLALDDLQTLHPEVRVHEEFLQHHCMEWTLSWASGIAFFFPGQWKNLYADTLKPEPGAPGQEEPLFYFAGEHLSKHHAWIEGALESGALAALQMFSDRAQAQKAAARTEAKGMQPLAQDNSLDDVFSDELISLQ